MSKLYISRCMALAFNAITPPEIMYLIAEIIIFFNI